MTELALVGDIGGTNSRFGLVEPGSTRIRDIEVLKNNNFGSLEESIGAYVKMQGISDLTAAAIAVAGPIEGETVVADQPRLDLHPRVAAQGGSRPQIPAAQ